MGAPQATEGAGLRAKLRRSGSLGLRGRVVMALGISIALHVVLSALVQDHLLEFRLALLARQELQETAHLALESFETQSPAQAVQRVGAERGARVQLVDEAGEIRADSAGLTGRSLATPLRAFVAGEQPALTLDRQGQRVLHVAARSPRFGAVLVSRRLFELGVARESLAGLLLTAGGLVLGLALLLAAYFSRTIINPIRELSENADRLAGGDFSQRLLLSRDDELGQLSASVNDMADHLVQQIRSSRAQGARFRTVLNTMVEAVLVIAPEGRIVHSNRAFDRLFGAPETEAVFEAAHLGEEVLEAVKRTQALRKETAPPQELDIRLQTRKGPEARYFTCNIAHLVETKGIVIVLHDITKLRLTDQVRRDFITNASHELRTPLTAVRGFAETVAGGVDDEATRQRFLQRIVSNTIRLQRLVDDMFTLSKSEEVEQPLTLQPVDVIPMIRDIVETLETKAASKGIKLHTVVPESLMIRADEQALDQVLVNLVDNAIKYSERGEVTIAAQLTDAAAARVELVVRDTGPGIPAAHQARIFERFYRVDPGRSREQGGTGLGLAIVRHLVSRMQGSIKLESAEGQGCTFRIRLHACT